MPERNRPPPDEKLHCDDPAGPRCLINMAREVGIDERAENFWPGFHEGRTGFGSRKTKVEKK
jgi:hypothetical protein